MKNIIIAGAGIIGNTIAHWLASSGNYQVFVIDIKPQAAASGPAGLFRHQLDVQDNNALVSFIKKHNIEAIASSLPYFCNNQVAQVAKEMQLHYFDLTEDTEVTDYIEQLAKGANTSFAPQCGLAPGFINIVANSLIQKFDEVDTVKLRCGALPMSSSHSLRYSCTWSTDGLINEYINPCHAIENGQFTRTKALEGLEAIQIDGLNYEAFNTSGGLGSLAKTYNNKIAHMDYKTIRYPGHADKMHFLLRDLKLNKNREILKDILNNALPYTNEDVVLIYVDVYGNIDGRYVKSNYMKKFYPIHAYDKHCTAIQLTTTAGACSIIDIVLNNPNQHKGYVKQEDFSLDEILANQFGRLLAY